MENKTNGNRKKPQYILAYGFRRYSVCKKLGWETIPCYISKTREIKEMPIKDIIVMDNTRLHDKEDDFIELMRSIKENGLLEPIGIAEEKDITKINFIVTNLLENIHRKGITPYELSKAVKDLSNLGLNNKEIAVRLSMPLGRIDNVRKISEKVPDDIIRETSFIENRTNPEGKLPVAVVSAVSSFHISPTKSRMILKKAKKESWTMSDIQMVKNLMNAGMDINKTMQEKKKYLVHNARVCIIKSELDKMNYKGSLHNLINFMLIGKIPLNKKLFYFERTPKIKTEEE